MLVGPSQNLRNEGQGQIHLECSDQDLKILEPQLIADLAIDLDAINYGFGNQLRIGKLIATQIWV